MSNKDFIIVENDKKVFIESLNQYKTYGGLLIGLPNERRNNRIVINSVAKAKEQSFSKTAHLFMPQQKPIEVNDGQVYKEAPMALPEITCIAELVYDKPLTIPDRPMSCLCVIWYQDNYAFPIEESVLKQFENLEWSKLAIDYEL